MEQSFCSSMIAKLKVAFPYYFKDMSKEEIYEMIRTYKDSLNYNPIIIESAIKEIIKTSKFMPSIGEIIEACEKVCTHQKLDVIEKMKKDNYFKSDWEVEKIYRFIEKGLIPDWLLDDMKRYGFVEERMITNNETKYLEVNNV